MDHSTFESADPILDEMGRYGQFHLVWQLLGAGGNSTQNVLNSAE
jgi:hypothetical protein